jgi:glutathione S-transferase kappa 1
VAEILKAASEKEWKDKLLANTQKALDLGAFGAPWFWVRNGEGKEEPFFGSDRYVLYGDGCRKQGIPFTDIEIIPKGGEKAKL